jgi:SOS response regulatory protein OraA/RecX
LSEELSDAVVARVLDLGYLNDSDYALRRARLMAEKGYGDFSIRNTLEGLDFPENMADDVVQKVSRETSEEERIASLLRKRGVKDREKTIRFLAGRGFPYEKILGALGGEDR